MTDHTPEFLACYPEYYGSRGFPRKPDFARCRKSVNVNGIWSSAQCTRKNGHGPHGAYCKQHDPDAIKAKQVARDAKWQAEWDTKARDAEFTYACRQAIRDIAAGHNDPHGLAQSIIDKLGGAQ